MFDVNSGQATQVAQHDAPIKAVGWVDAQSGILATGSWDKTIKVFLFLLQFFGLSLIFNLVLGFTHS